MQKIELANGSVALVDDENYEYLSTFKWSQSGGGYARTVIARKPYYMHKMVMMCGSDDMVDHIDGNKLNNQKFNLRKCTQLENSRNRKLDKRNKSGYKGVSWYTRNGMWRANISINSKVITLGLFSDPKEAAMAYDIAAITHFGEFAKTNKSMGLLK